MKVRLAAVAAVLALTASAMPALAQGPGGPGGGPGRRMQALLNGITLTPQQQTRIDSIVASLQTQMPPFTPGQPPDPTAMQQRRALFARQDSLVREVLTPEQRAVFDRNAQNMPRGGPPQGGPPRPPGR